ncbi:glycosyltransferase family 2 protein [Archangium lipolyticum]|uniref:glycosyltransferase family 2 protein n=1 Tax=Archangium lipolyticum TaxID=2970465 RepID=UPI00214A5DC9|nr:glycosyltransferase family 2 protein [Archangium lipolyticum]
MEDEPPLVSCVMITSRRARFVEQSIRYFLAQDVARKELIIIHEEEGDLPPTLPEGAGIRVERVPRGLSLGEKRNAGVALARGGIIAQWDDDDWYGPQRLSRQLAPLLEGTADITALQGALVFELDAWNFWACSPRLHARMFLKDVIGGTLVYRRDLWREGVRYPPANLREDADFLVAAMQRGARLARLSARDLFLYVRHGRNTWRFAPGHLLDPGEWWKVLEPASLGADRAFYLAQRNRPSTPDVAVSPPARSRVSCIMPTFDREEFVPRAIRHFLRQGHPDTELIIVDDGSRPVEELIPDDARIHYLREGRRSSIGHKRNLACERATGEIILHWDDDDWMASDWIELQARVLLGELADVCGLSRPLFYNPVRREAWRYEYPRHERPWVHGGTLCYTRSLWRRNPFPDTSHGEDVLFLQGPEPKKLVAHSHWDKYVAYLHTKNTSARPRMGSRWRPIPVTEVERLMLADGRPHRPGLLSPNTFIR